MWEIGIFDEMIGNGKWGISCNQSWKRNAIFTVMFKLLGS